MFVDPSCRGSKIGAAILDQLELHARRLGPEPTQAGDKRQAAGRAAALRRIRLRAVRAVGRVPRHARDEPLLRASACSDASTSSTCFRRPSVAGSARRLSAAAATSSSPKRFPGCRVMRSIGPEMLTAATIDGRRPSTGALTDATPDLALLDALDPSVRGRRRRSAPCPADPASSGNSTPSGHDPAQRVRRLQRQHAAPLVRLRARTAARSRPVSSRKRSSTGSASAASGKRSAPSRPSAASSGPRSNRPVVVTPQQPVLLERDRQAVRRRARQVGGLLQIGQRPRLGSDGTQHGNRLVEHADAGYDVHTARTLSQKVGMSQ